ncbi:MAG: hypothetical protein ACRD4S_12700 [Candidatus Acidiferrales bacterium]
MSDKNEASGKTGVETQSKPTGSSNSKVEFSGTKGRVVGGNTAEASAGAEQHGGGMSGYDKGKKVCGQDSPISEKK